MYHLSFITLPQNIFLFIIKKVKIANLGIDVDNVIKLTSILEIDIKT